MALTQRTLLSMPEFMTRLAVTLGALVVYRLGTHLPLPGIDHAALANLLNHASPLATMALGRLTVFGLGVTPIISTLLLAEVARLASSRFNEWAGATPANARRVDHYVLIGSLLVAAVQGHGIASALEEMKNVVDEPGPQFRLVNVDANDDTRRFVRRPIVRRSICRRAVRSLVSAIRRPGWRPETTVDRHSHLECRLQTAT